MTTKSTPNKELRLRVFAGPNGSGKSTVIEAVRKHKTNNKPIDFGYYINADDISVSLKKNHFKFTAFNLSVTNEDFKEVVYGSGLINSGFSRKDFERAYTLQNNIIRLREPGSAERLAQIIADFLRKKLIAKKDRFSFETVFSHPSKLEIMRQAAAAGYKVYLYFVSTETPKINIYRVRLRAQQGGHDVPSDKIESRYYRSLNLLYEACQIAYQTFFFDNSIDNSPFSLFAHFKIYYNRKRWDPIRHRVPHWFVLYYLRKIKRMRGRQSDKNG